MLITKAQALESAAKLPFEDVPVPELAEDGEARICTMTGLEFDEWSADAFPIQKDGITRKAVGKNWQGILVSHCWRDENRERLFQSTEEILSVGSMSARVLGRLFKVARRLNGIGEDMEAAIEKK